MADLGRYRLRSSPVERVVRVGYEIDWGQDRA